MPTPSKVSKQSKSSQEVPSRSGHPDTPPDSPIQPTIASVFTTEHIQQFLDILNRASQGTSNPGPEASGSKKKEEEKKSRVRASKIEFITVNRL